MQAILVTADADERDILTFVLRHAGLSVSASIDLEQVTVNVEKAGNTDVLELNVVLSPLSPEAPRARSSAWTPVPPAPRRPIGPLGSPQPAWWER